MRINQHKTTFGIAIRPTHHQVMRESKQETGFTTPRLSHGDEVAPQKPGWEVHPDALLLVA